jgi:PAS domain S-box-containing protein
MSHLKTAPGTGFGPETAAFFDALPFYVLLVDATHHIWLANKAVTEQLKLDPGQIVGRYCPQAIHGLDQPFPGCPLEEAVEKGHAVERELYDPGSDRWLLSAIYPSEQRTPDNQALFVHMVHDITERKHAEEEVQRNYDIQTCINSLLQISLLDGPFDQLLTRAIDAVLSIPWLAFESRGCIFLTDGDLVMKAQSGLAEAIQRTCARVPFGRCLCGQAALTRQIQFAACVDQRHEISYEGMGPHGHYCVPILRSGRTIGVINVYLTAGHRRNDKEEQFLSTFANTLAGVVMRRQMQEDKEKAQVQFLQAQKMEAVGTLAAGIAHDFNNLLTAISGFGRLAHQAVPPDSPARDDLQQVLRSAEQASQLTKRLLLFSRRNVAAMGPLNLNDVVVDLHKTLRRLIGENIELVTLPAEGIGPISGDRAEIEQAIINLVVNARDAMPQGGRLVIQTAAIRPDENSMRTKLGLRAGEFIRLSVSDTGIGIPDDAKARLFEPFFTTKEKGKGTGLGLVAVHAIAARHEGNVWVDSEIGRGTTVEMYFPRSEAPGRSTDATRHVTTIPTGTETILVVEDDSVVRDLIVRILRRLGYVVLEAADATAALDMLATSRGKVDLLLTDIVMPGMSGTDLAERMLCFYPDVKILFVSGYTDAADKCEALIRSAGARFLEKPFSEEALARQVRAVLDR